MMFQKKTLRDFISENSINCFYIAFGQFYEGIDLTGIKTKVIMFIHDIFDIERCDNKIDYAITDPYKLTLWRRFKEWRILLLADMPNKLITDIMTL